MAEKYNNANEVSLDILTNRNQIEVRATWLAMIYQEMIDAGIENTEQILRKAIFKYGLNKGAGVKNAVQDPQDMRQFAEKTPSPTGRKTFNMDEIHALYDEVPITFNYCPLVAAWEKLGLDEETIELLCDIAMDGDRGLAEAMGFDLDISDTIAKGCKTCELHYTKR